MKSYDTWGELKVKEKRERERAVRTKEKLRSEGCKAGERRGKKGDKTGERE